MRHQMCRFTNCNGSVEMRAIGDHRFEGLCDSCGERHDCMIVPASSPWCSDGSNGFVERARKGRVAGADPHRAALVRLVVAQQWAVAIAFYRLQYAQSVESGAVEHIAEAEASAAMSTPGMTRWAVKLQAALPCAVDVIADLLGAP